MKIWLAFAEIALENEFHTILQKVWLAFEDDV